jgi:hypothetical protein
MNNANKAQIYLNKILQSQEFAKATKYRELLQYLVKASLEGKSPKEITIAYDVFGVEPKQDKVNDTNIRVYIHNLRKKLDSYYLHESQDDEIQLEIPKGCYQVNFINKSRPAKLISRHTILYTAFVILFLSILLNIYFIQSNKSKFSIDNPIKKNNPVWEDYFKSKLPILIVLGDYFLYKDSFIPNRTRYIRDFRINSPVDLEQFLTDSSSYKEYIIETEHTLLGKLAPWCLYNLQSTLLPINSQIELKLSSKLQWSDLKKYNILFVGSFKTLGIFRELIKKLHFTYQIDPNLLYYHPPNADTSFSYHASQSLPDSPYETDYAVIVKFPGPNHNVITMFASTRDIGCLATVDFLTSPRFLDPFINENIKKAPAVKYFEAIFEVQGYERTVISTTLLHFNILNSHP